VKVADPYRFMEETQNPKVKAWVDSQNNLTDQFLSQCEYREKFKKTLTENYNFTKIGIPIKHGDYYYFDYNSGLLPQAQWYRVKEKGSYVVDNDNPLKDAELFLDPNKLSKDNKTKLGD